MSKPHKGKQEVPNAYGHADFYHAAAMQQSQWPCLRVSRMERCQLKTSVSSFRILIAVSKSPKWVSKPPHLTKHRVFQRCLNLKGTAFPPSEYQKEKKKSHSTPNPGSGKKLTTKMFGFCFDFSCFILCTEHSMMLLPLPSPLSKPHPAQTLGKRTHSTAASFFHTTVSDSCRV